MITLLQMNVPVKESDEVNETQWLTVLSWTIQRIQVTGIGYLYVSGSEWNCQPRHFCEVCLPLILASIGADEDDLKLVSNFLLHLLVELSQLWGESATWWTPVR